MTLISYIWKIRNEGLRPSGWVGVLRYFWNLFWWYVYPCPKDCPKRNGYFSDKCEICEWAHKR